MGTKVILGLTPDSITIFHLPIRCYCREDGVCASWTMHWSGEERATRCYDWGIHDQGVDNKIVRPGTNKRDEGSERKLNECGDFMF